MSEPGHAQSIFIEVFQGLKARYVKAWGEAPGKRNRKSRQACKAGTLWRVLMRKHGSGPSARSITFGACSPAGCRHFQPSPQGTLSIRARQIFVEAFRGDWKSRAEFLRKKRDFE